MANTGLGTPDYFKRRYKGPIGSHLQHQTFFTQTGTAAKADTQRSIHPRVAGGRTVFAKSDTSRPRRSA